MRRSDQRILTTHVGSLPRDPKLSDLLIRDEAGEKVDQAELKRLGEQAVHHVVRQQMACGVDVINDGEQPRVGFQTYVPQRMKGFGGESKRPRSRDWTDFPGYAEFMAARMPRRSKVTNAPQAIADVKYEDLGPAKEEIRLFQAALKDLATPPAETFMTAAAPGIIATTMLNAHYDTHEAYVFALAREMKKEYELIARDFILQIDRPTSRWNAPCCSRTRPTRSSWRSRRCMSRRSTRRSAASRASACGCIAAGATTRARTRTTSRCGRSCPSSTRPRSARCRSSSPIRVISTNTPPSRTRSCRRNSCCCRA